MRFVAIPLSCVFLFPAPAAAQCRMQTLAPSDGGPMGFGAELAVAGPVLVVGAFNADGADTGAGAAYVFRQGASGWLEEQKLFASDGVTGDLFGAAVAVSTDGSWILVGAPRAGPQGYHSGAAYVYSFDGQRWQEDQKLIATGGEAIDQFGSSVAIDGSWAAVGLPWDNGACPSDPFCNSGAVALFEYDGVTWQPRQQVSPAAAARGDYFGSSLVLDSGRLVAGAPGDGQVAPEAGAAYVFTYDGTTWNEGQKLIPSAGDDEDQFGTSLAQDGDLLVVGAMEAGPFSGDTSDVYLFRDDGQGYQEEARLEPTDTSEWNWYGSSVAVAQGQLLVGAPQSSDVDPQAGAAYLYRDDGRVWNWHQKLLPPVSGWSQNYGAGVGWSGRQAFLGAPLPSKPGGGPGAVYVWDIPYLSLSATPAAPKAGDTLQWLLDEGLPSGRFVVAVVDVDGVTTWIRLVLSSFDPLGQWTRSDQVPPGLAGTVMTFLSAGADNCGILGLSGCAVVSFQ